MGKQLIGYFEYSGATYVLVQPVYHIMVHGATNSSIVIDSSSNKNDIMKQAKRFTIKDSEILAEMRPFIKYASVNEFNKLLNKHKCNCSKNCSHLIFGACYNIPSIGPISIPCFDRIAKQIHDSNPFSVMRFLHKKRGIKFF